MNTGRRTQQERRESAEAALLAAAAELVVEGGVRALTLAAVGEKAGYSRGLITHHLGSKRVLLERLARTTQAGFVPGLGEVAPGLHRLLRLVDGYLEALGRRTAPHPWAFLLLWAEAATEPDLAAIFRERDDAFRADLRRDVDAGIEEGTIRPDADPTAVAVAVLGQLRGIGLQQLLDPPAVDLSGLQVAVVDQWRRALSTAGDSAC